MEEELTERQPPRGRPRLGGNGRYTQLYEMNAVCVDKKLAVLGLFAATCDIKTTIARYYPTLLNTSQYNTKRTQIYRWRKNEAKLRAAARGHRGQHKKVRAAGLGTVLSSAAEEEIVQWVNELRKDGIPISPFMLKETAKERCCSIFFFPGWWNSGLSVEFLKFHFADRSDSDTPVLLLWDHFSGHRTGEVRKYAASINVILYAVPAHATSAGWQTDVAWNHPFKTRLRQCWLEHMKNQINESSHNGPFKLVPPGRTTIAQWIKSSWEDLSATTIANGCRKCDLLPTNECVAAASLVALLKKLSTVSSSRSFDSDSDFDRADSAN